MNADLPAQGVTFARRSTGDLADVTLVSLHLALADQIVVMLQGGATAADIDPIIESVWNRLRAIGAGTGPQTHRNESPWVC